MRRLILGPPGSLVSLTITSQIETDAVYTPRNEAPVPGIVPSLPTSGAHATACGCFSWSRRRGRAGLDGHGNGEAETSKQIVQAAEESGEEVRDEERKSGAQVGADRGNGSEGAGGANEGDCGREEGESAYETERLRREMLFSCEFEELADWEVGRGIACVALPACLHACVRASNADVCACVQRWRWKLKRISHNHHQTLLPLPASISLTAPQTQTRPRLPAHAPLARAYRSA